MIMTKSEISIRYISVLGFALLAAGSAISQQTSPSTPNPSTPPGAGTISSQPAPSSATPDATKQPAESQPQTNVSNSLDASSPTSSKPGNSTQDKSDTANPANSTLPQEAGEAANASSDTPTTTIMPQTKEVKSIDSLMEPPPLPKGKVSLIGGTVQKIDQIRNRMTVEIFGKGKMKVFFDERSHIYRNGVATTQLAIHKGDRIYIDTQSSQGKIFARNIQVQTNTDAASVSGQIVSFNSNNGTLVLHDALSSQPVTLKLTTATVISQQGQPGTRGDLLPESLVTVRYAPTAGRPIKEVEVLARKGAQFPFYGTLTHLDLRSGLLAVDNKSDGKVYDIKFVPSRIGVTDELTAGAEVAVVTTFDGHDYTAQTVKVTRVAKSEKSDKGENEPR